jgi:hypothetical protein
VRVLVVQAASKTINEDDVYFQRVSVRSAAQCAVQPIRNRPDDCWAEMSAGVGELPRKHDRSATKESGRGVSCKGVMHALLYLCSQPKSRLDDLFLLTNHTCSSVIKYPCFPLVVARLPGLAAAAAAAGSAAGGALRRFSGSSSIGSPAPGGAAEPAGTGPDGWDALALHYRVEWPLQLLLTPEVLGK